LAFSSDGFESAKLALGQINLPEGGVSYGLVADVIIGHLLAGNTLRISNEGNNFLLDSTGATLTNASFTLDNSKSRITLDPTTGISIQKKTSASPSIGIGTASSSSGASVSGLTWNHTVPNQSERILVVTIGSAKSGIPSTASVTFAGQALTKLTELQATNHLSEIWYLKNPPIGTGSIVVTCSSATWIEAGATVYWNVDQTTTFGTPASASGISTTASVNVTSAVGDLVIDSLSYWNNTASTFSVGTGQTQIYHVSIDGSWKGGSSRENGASSVTMSWSGNSSDWILVSVSLIKSSSSYTLTDTIYLDIDGNAVFAGDISGASGTFSGAINATTGNIGTLTIDSNGLSDGSGNYLRGNGDLNWGPLNITGSTGTFDGTFYAANMNGQIVDSQIADLSADKITAGTISAVTISGSTINGGTINGTTINWPGVSMYGLGLGWSRLDFGKLEMVETGSTTYLSMDGGIVILYAEDELTLTTNAGTINIEGYLYSNISGDGGYGYSDKLAVSTPSGTRYWWFDNGILTNVTTT
jgi:hypothetical protein